MNPILFNTDAPEQREIVKALIEAKSPYIQANTNNGFDWFYIGSVRPDFYNLIEVEHCFVNGWKFRLTIPKYAEQSGESNSPEMPDSSTVKESLGVQCTCLDTINSLMKIQGSEPLLGKDEYMRGMYNGMEVIRASLMNCEGVFRESDKPKCQCGFDSEGWRDITNSDQEIRVGDQCGKNGSDWYGILSGGEAVGRKAHSYNLKFRTRRHKADCPTLQKNELKCEHLVCDCDCCSTGQFPPVTEPDPPADKPPLDLAGFSDKELQEEAQSLKEGRMKYEPAHNDWIYLQIAMLRINQRKIEDHINQTK